MANISILLIAFSFYRLEKKIPSTFMKEQLKGLEKTMEMLIVVTQIIKCKNWSYVANKKIGLKIDYWVQLTKNIEDKLSDKLHEELTKSFIDKKSVFLKKFKTRSNT